MNKIFSLVACFVFFLGMVHAEQDPISQIQKLVPAGLPLEAQCGRNLAVEGLRMVTGAHGAMKAWIYRRVGGQFQIETALTPVDGSSTGYGFDVMIHGDWVAVGAYKDGQIAFNSGAVYMYRMENGQWVHKQKIKAPDAGMDNYFGNSVDIDGDTMVVGALGDNDRGFNSGSAYVYRLSAGTWILEQKLLDLEGVSGDLFGTHVAISGNTLIADSRADDNIVSDGGSVVVYTRTGTTWTQQQRVFPSDLGSGDMFGYVLDIEDDRFAASCFYHDADGYNSGAAYIYKRQDNGLWAMEQKLRPSDPSVDKIFGRSVSIRKDRILVGATNDNQMGLRAGAAYLFKLQRNNTWVEDRKIVGSDSATEDQFGISVGLSDHLAAVGAYKHNGNRGAVYMFHENTITPAVAYAKIHGTREDPVSLVIPSLPEGVKPKGLTFVLQVKQTTGWVEVSREMATDDTCPRFLDKAYSAREGASYRFQVIDELQFAGPESEGIMSTPAADLDGNGYINKFDYAILKSLTGTHEGDPAWNLQADLEMDGVIDGSDMDAFKTWFILEILPLNSGDSGSPLAYEVE